MLLTNFSQSTQGPLTTEIFGQNAPFRAHFGGRHGPDIREQSTENKKNLFMQKNEEESEFFMQNEEDEILQ